MRNHFSVGSGRCSLGNATFGPTPVTGMDISLPAPTSVSNLRMNGLRLKVWPQLVDGLTGETGNFTLRIADPACDPEEGCVGMGGDKVCFILMHNQITLKVVHAPKLNQNPFPSLLGRSKYSSR